jgi:succinyl-CoA synthetase beta subunit
MGIITDRRWRRRGEFGVLDLYEYQGKELLRQFDIETLEGRVAANPEEAHAAAEELGGPVAVKAQVLTGGRGKAGGIKVVAGAGGRPKKAARQILGMEIGDHTVRQVLVEAGADIASEMYLSILVDRAEKKPLILFSTEGGVDIEEVAETNPDSIVRIYVIPCSAFCLTRCASSSSTPGSRATSPRVWARY